MPDKKIIKEYITSLAGEELDVNKQKVSNLGPNFVLQNNIKRPYIHFIHAT